MSVDQGIRDFAYRAFTSSAQQAVQHPHQREGSIVRQGVVMGDVALGQRPLRCAIGVADGRQRHRQYAHGRAISGIAFEEGSFDRALRDVAAYAAAARVADVCRTCLQPFREFIAYIVDVEFSPPHQRTAKHQGHFSIVSHSAGGEAQPAASYDVAVDAVPGSDFSLGHELDGGAEGIADGKAEKGRERPIFQAQARHCQQSLS